MANALGFSMGDVLANVESIKTARANRAAVDVDTQSRKLDLSTKRTAVDRNNNALALRTAAIEGDKSAMPQLVALNPDEAIRFTEALTAMSAPEQAEARRGIEEMGRLAVMISQSDDPAGTYAQVIQALPEQERAKYPPTYSPQVIDLWLARAADFDTLVDHTLGKETAREEEAAEIRAEDRQERADAASDTRKHQFTMKEIEARAKNDKALAAHKAELDQATDRLQAELDAAGKGAGATGREIKSADSNAIYNRVASLFGGIYTQQPDGSFAISGLDATASLRALKVAELAEVYWRNDSSIGHAEAAKKAAEALDFDFEGADAAADNDPLGLRGG